MVSTRSSTPVDNDKNVSIDQHESKIPTSDLSKSLKVLISPKAAIHHPIYRFPHPKSNALVLLVIGPDFCAEVMRAGENYRSWFYGNDIVEDGCMQFFSPVHPIFFALPYFLKSKDKFLELDQILTDPEMTVANMLTKNNQFMKNIVAVADIKEVCDTLVYRYNEEKMLQWIKIRHEKIKTALILEGALHKSVAKNVDALDRYAFGVLCDYLAPDISATAKTHLNIVDAIEAIDEKIEIYKRKTLEDDFYKPKEKKQKESAIKKQLVQASKNSKSISSFFTKK